MLGSVLVDSMDSVSPAIAKFKVFTHFRKMNLVGLTMAAGAT